jgi:hypothetical protein
MTGCTRTDERAVTPAERDLGFRRVDEFEIHADLGHVSVSHEPLDLVLLFDRTASMENTIAQAQRNADAIVRSVRTLYPNSSFAVAGLADYFGGEQPWILFSDLTKETMRIRDALEAITLANGHDYPEAYARALYESRFVSWRPGAQKYIVLFGDAPAHDPSFYGTDFGIDPGRDGIPDTHDDLMFKSVVADLVKDSIVVLAIYDDTFRKSLKAETRAGFDYMARQTGGVSVPISSATDVVEVVKQSLRRVLQPAPTLAAPAEFADWVEHETFTRDSANMFSAPVQVLAPERTKSGIYRLPLYVVRNHSAGADTVGATSVIVRVGMLNYPWRIPLLFVFLFSVLGLLLRRIHRASRNFVRYEQNMTYLRLLGRLIVVGLAILGGVLIWKHAPGTLPAKPGPSSGVER